MILHENVFCISKARAAMIYLISEVEAFFVFYTIRNATIGLQDSHVVSLAFSVPKYIVNWDGGITTVPPRHLSSQFMKSALDIACKYCPLEFQNRE